MGCSKDGNIKALDMKVYSNGGCSRDVSVEVRIRHFFYFEIGFVGLVLYPRHHSLAFAINVLIVLLKYCLNG